MDEKLYSVCDLWWDTSPYGEVLVLEIEYHTKNDCEHFCYVIRRTEIVERRKEYERMLKRRTEK